MFKTLIGKIKLYAKGGISYARNQGVVIGEGCNLIGYPDFGSEPYLITIGNHVEICSHVVFLTHDGATWVFRNEEKYRNVIKFGKIVIEDNCFIGKGTTILPGVRIGKNSIVGACSLVTRDVPENSVFAGVPARFVCETQAYAEKCLQNMPKYDVQLYRKNKKEAVLKMLDSRMK